LTSEVKPKDPQLNSGINTPALCRSMLEIVAYLDETQYTESNSTRNERQAEENQLNDLSNPASDYSTTQG
jgi:hypothetical protein